MKLSEFKREYAVDINNLLNIFIQFSKKEKFKINDEEKLFKNLIHYIYLNSYRNNKYE
jgi:hypothetical protein